MKFRSPSMGLILMVVLYSLAGLFFAWGLAVPKQDRIWTVAQKLRAGNINEIDPEDLLFFEHELSQNDSLASWLLMGRPDGIISPNTLGWVDKPALVLARIHNKTNHCFLELNLNGPRKLFPIKIRAEALSWQVEKTFSSPGLQTIEIPALDNKAELIVIRRLFSTPSTSTMSMRLELSCLEKPSRAHAMAGR